MVEDTEFYDHLPILQMWVKTHLNAYGPDNHSFELSKFHHLVLYTAELALCHYPYQPVVGTDTMLEGSLTRDPEYSDQDLAALHSLIPGIFFYNYILRSLHYR